MHEDEMTVSILFAIVMVAVFCTTSLVVDRFDLFGKKHKNVEETKTCEGVENA